ncbi:MAG: transposase [Gammaproteobacteria bacterium]|nr:transposase [Gammaproteobacteria bacterium]MBT5223051.1 transposase [Gammaproteobacteria bacterium]MBT5826287.1 transposase [Gammaproteobacteria bacterium]MBT6420510.1 transposase [Gammaproteobacteria bacterium]MBT6575003.1 transposase [Gammaproteobacteria bacterium]
MKIDHIDVESAVKNTQQLLEAEHDISPALKSALEMILLLVTVLLNRVTLNSKNSSKPPASDPNRKNGSRKKSDKPPGGQKSHVGTTLQKIENPDEIEVITLDRSTLPKGQYTEDGFETRQVFDIDISRGVTEYQAQRLINEKGQCFIAPFPGNITKAAQYGNGIKTHIVYLSQYPLLPYNRIQEYVTDQLGMPISEGSIYNFNKQAYEQLAEFEAISKEHLVGSPCIHADETGINITGKRHWLNGTSNDQWTHFFPHAKRGAEAMNDTVNDAAIIRPDSSYAKSLTSNEFTAG